MPLENHIAVIFESDGVTVFANLKMSGFTVLFYLMVCFESLISVSGVTVLAAKFLHVGRSLKEITDW